ncbi:MAG TPA: HNH endonuclease [Verrucomicrobiae bacterium]
MYRKLTFGQLHARNPVVIQLAERMSRPPGSVAMKLCNFASLDPVVTANGRKGLEGASTLDRALWKEFLQSPAAVIPVSEELFHKLFSSNEADEVEVIKDKGVKVARKTISKLPIGETTVTAEVQVRRGQDYFRQVILNAFNNRCCVSGIPIRSMLVASHILPWSNHPSERLNPANGLCLSRIHDVAFDRHLITFDEDYRLVLSKGLKTECTNAVLKQSFSAYEGKRINLSEETTLPNQKFLEQHRNSFAR